MKRHHHFIFHLAVLTIGTLIAVALGLLYYYDLEDHFLEIASAQKSPRQYLLARAAEKGLDADLLDRIVWCESRWKMQSNAASTAHGFFQILDLTEKGTPQYQQGLRKTDPYVNIDMGIYLFDRYGWLPWNESRPCWWGA